MTWHSLDIALPKTARARRAYAAYARGLRAIANSPSRTERLLNARKEVTADVRALPTQHQAIYRASAMVLTDLALQGWKIKVSRDDGVAVAAPTASNNRERAREAIRTQELLKRDEQLAASSVKNFISSMERKRLFEGGFVSIFSLMRDGRELSEALRKSRGSSLNGDALADVIRPYIEFVDGEKRCAFTGYRLMDIWRYFRHTWTNQYSSVPGRNMMLLVRDAAATNHPVIGIASIASPIVQINERDKWLGWHPETFIERIRSRPTAKLARWLLKTVDGAIDEIFKADFVQQKLLSRWTIQHPNDDVIRRLRNYAAQQRKRHHRYSRRTDFKDDGAGRQSVHHWRAQAKTPLYKSKRAQALADLLEIRGYLKTHFGSRCSANKLRTLVDTAAGRRVVRKVVRKAKADRVGVAMADISVCGAVQPYNAVLGGKLVSMLAVGPSVVAEYRRRYQRAVSQIASSMAGRPIVRPANLVYLGTTSLYGNGSSQYNRVRIPAHRLGGSKDDAIVYQEIGESESYGTSQFSNETVDAIVACLRQSTNGERVNSIFGEGVSPRLRKMREGLALLGFPQQKLLQHLRRRSVYGITLARNIEDYLIGLDRRPAYIIPATDGGNDAIVAWWRYRWLSGRVQSDAVLDQVSRHGHVHPLCHGARVATNRPHSDYAETRSG